METASQSSVIAKLRKLQAMVERGTENEAMIASEKILEIMAKYNLEMADIKEVEQPGVDAESFTEKYNEQWRRTIVLSVAKLYFCKGFYQSCKIAGSVSARPQSGVKYTFIGRVHNRALAVDMARYLVNTVNRLANEGAVRELQGPSSTERGRYVNSFRLACSIRLRERINDMVDRAKRGDLLGENGEKLPALLNLYTTEATLAEQWLLGAGVKLRTTKSRAGFGSAFGAMQGAEAGGKIGLNAQVGMGNRATMISHRKH